MARAEPEYWFYHLPEGAGVDEALPALLEKTLHKGWRAVVYCRDELQRDQLDDMLWTYRDDSFLPHGRAGTAEADRQPVLLTVENAQAHAAEAVFVLSARTPPNGESVERVVIMFEDSDGDARQHARERWKALKGAGATVSYWRRGPAGRWEKQ